MIEKKLKKIVSISDQHGELAFKMPSGDILTISGDICEVRGSHSPTSQMYWLKAHFLPWCDWLIQADIVKHVVFVAGNHDFVFKKIAQCTTGDFVLDLPKNVHYLCDNMVEIDGVKIYGTPWTPTFGNWAYMTNEDALDNIFSKIPEGLDILLSHGPAYGWNDTIMQYPERAYGRDEHIGSKSLRKHILRAKPLWTCVGHIHSGSHKVTRIANLQDRNNENFVMEDFNVVNVSILDEDYEKAYDPTTFVINKE